jgi:hypothetical protein
MGDVGAQRVRRVGAEGPADACVRQRLLRLDGENRLRIHRERGIGVLQFHGEHRPNEAVGPGTALFSDGKITRARTSGEGGAG